jgi:hypothetical protein
MVEGKISEGKILNLEEIQKLDFWFIKSIVY